MNYRQALLFRWSTRDILAILVLAVIVAFLTGGTLFYTAAKDRPLEIAEEFQPAGQVTEYESVRNARQMAGETDIVLRFVDLDQTGQVLIEVTQSDRERADELGLELPTAPATGIGKAGVQTRDETTIRTTKTTVTVQVHPIQGTDLLPTRWYITDSAVIDRVGVSGAFVVSPPTKSDSRGASVRRSQSVIRSTLLFFERGTEQVLRGFGLVVLAAGLLGAVTIASVVQMTIRDRRQTIQIIRATGATPASIIGVFGLRGVLLTGTAVVLGYALGVIVSSAVTSVAVFATLPTTLSPRVTGEAARLLTLVYGSLLAVGFGAAMIVAIPVVRRPPGQLTQQTKPRGRVSALYRRARTAVPGGTLVETRVLDWRAALPTIATIAVFAALVLLVIAGGVVAEPLAANSSTTVLEPGAKHPVASTVPESYATAYTTQNVSASPEILVFGVVNDEPTLIRGGDYESFAAVSDADLTQGRTPQVSAEAVIGSDLAETHDLTVGETVVIGAGTQETVERVHIVGIYRAPGAYDDQILVSLPSARHLTMKQPGEVNFVRLSESRERTDMDPAVRIVSMSVRGKATTTDVSVSLSVVNIAETNQTRNLSVEFDRDRVTKRVTVPPGGQRELTVQFTPTEPGSYTLSAGHLSRKIDVENPNALRISGVPSEAPPGSAPRIRVLTVGGTPAENATVTVNNQTFRTNVQGYVRLPLSQSGTAEIRASRGNFTANESIEVTTGVNRELDGSLTVIPGNVSEFAQPIARLRLDNPWNTTATGRVEIQAPDHQVRKEYRVESGETTRQEIDLARLPAGQYTVAAYINGTQVAETPYVVSGDDRLSTVVIRNTDAATGSGLGAAISVVFGNLTVVVTALVTLAALMMSGALVASFASAIHARRETLGIYRATGASPISIVSMVLWDALRIGLVSVIVGVALGGLLLTVLDTLGLLVFYGIRVAPSFAPLTIGAVSAIALFLVVFGALIPTLNALRQPPANSFTQINRPAQETTRE